jgi:hypothetical protein
LATLLATALLAALTRLLLPALARLLLLLAWLLPAAALLATALLAALLLLTGLLIVLVRILVRHTCHSLRLLSPYPHQRQVPGEGCVGTRMVD